MKLGECFAGYGGLGMAVEEVFGAELAWVSEWEEGPSKILAHHWPNVPNYGDITKIDWAGIEPVDIISGGFPCQDLSLAGKRKGMGAGTRSGLWANMLEGIETIRPRYVVAENVRGLLSGTAHSNVEPCTWCLGDDRNEPHLRALGAVLGDLSDLGYDTQWRGLRAADVGAPHGRFRVFLLAQDTRSVRGRAGNPATGKADSQGRDNLTHRPNESTLTDSDNTGREEQRFGVTTEQEHSPAERSRYEAWEEYAPAIARWESIMGRPAPAPTQPYGKNGLDRLNPAFPEWMMGLPEGHVSNSPATRSEQIKALGNGVVPQQAAAALRDMLAAFERQDAA